MNEPDKTDAELGVEWLERIETVIEMLDGYRAKLLAHGYSETAAEQMCVQMHATFALGMVRPQ